MDSDPAESRRDPTEGGRRPIPTFPPVQVGEDGHYIIPRGEEARARMEAFHRALIRLDEAAEQSDDDPRLDEEILKIFGVANGPLPGEPDL